MTNFLLSKFGKICIYIGPYELAFNDFEVMMTDEEDIEE